jgi:hypothetical protein
MKTPNRTSRESFVMEAVLKQLELAGVDPGVLTSDEQWYSNNEIEPAIHEEWKKWFIAETRKRFRFTKDGAAREFSYFDLSYGLKIKTSPDNSSK